MAIPQFAPGCFGSALTYRTNDLVCKSCPFAKTCEVEHIVALQALREKLGVSAKPKPLRGASRARADEENEDPTRATMPIKTRELLDRLDRMNLNIVERMRRGENPFLGKINYMAIAAHLLMRAQTPLHQRTLAAAFKMKLNWQDTTATAHARMAFLALEHVGAITFADGAATMRT